MQTVTISQAETPMHYEGARRLMLDHATALGDDFYHGGFEDELAQLPVMYGPPGGLLLVAQEGEAVIGCVAYRDRGEGVCEMKRLYVRPEARGRQLGRQLVVAIVDRAREAGYRRMVLDTLPTMLAAQALYREIGFVVIEPYYDNPIPNVTYLALDLG